MKHLILVFALALMALPAFAQQAPNDVIAQAAKELDQALSKRKAELAGDRQALYDLIDKILLPRFDRKYSAQLVLGSNWRDASDDQKKRFIDAFYRHLMQQYADGALDFDLSKVEILPFRGSPSDPRAMVRTIVTLDDGKKVPVDYAMVKRDEGWMMFDVTIEGISYVRNFRAELNSEIHATSLDAVIERLESDIENKSGNGAADSGKR